MKAYRLILTLSTLCFICPSFSQNQPNSDSDLTKNVVGTWQHVTSTDPDGNILSYKREIALFADGTGTCTKFIEADSIVLDFTWDVVDGAIMLYTYDKNGRKINTDSQLISDIDEMSLNLSNVFGTDDYGMSSLYRRSSEVVVKY